MKIIICPYSQKLPKVDYNPKNYPYWEELIALLKAEIPNLEVVQVGVSGERILKGVTTIKHNLLQSDLLELCKTCDAWFTVDNFFNHFCSYYKIPNGFVMFGQSDPNIFGYKTNTNILKDRKYLRPDQFGFWWDRPYKKEAFLEPEEVAKLVLPTLKST